MKKTLQVIHWLCRLSLGAMFLYTGYIKIQAPLQFAVTITGYKLVHDSIAYPLALYFPWVEIVLGLLILSGFKIRHIAWGAVALILMFIAMLTVTYMRGIEANCGCFSFDDRITIKTLLRDSLIILPALFLALESRFRTGRTSATS
jgi:putative oxidoreductase